MTLHDDWDNVLNLLFSDALQARDQALSVAEHTLSLEHAVDRLIANNLSTAAHPRTVEWLRELHTLHAQTYARVTRLVKDTLESLNETQRYDVQGQIAGIGAALEAAGPGVLSDPDVKVRLVTAFVDLPALLQTYKLYTAVVAMQLTSTLEVHDEAYRAVLGITEAPQRFLAASKRLLKAGASDAIGVFIPVTGTLYELFNIGKETRRPELSFNPALAGEQDRLNTFKDNLHRLLAGVSHASALADQAKAVIAKANDDFNCSVAEIRKLLQPGFSKI